MYDHLQKFMFNAAPVRGEIVSLNQTWREVLSRHNYPAPIRSLLGEMMAATALLSANLKFEGALVMQIYGDGPVKVLVVQCNSDLTMRATAKIVGEIDANASLTELINQSGGGRCAITLDPADKTHGQQPYQGVVPLEDEAGPFVNIAQIIEHYMRHSEQLDTRLWLAADQDQAVGLLLQKLPAKSSVQLHLSEEEADTWNRVCHLCATLSQDELLKADSETLLHRLFWQENLRRFESVETSFRCTCSRFKVGEMLKMLGDNEVNKVIDECGHVEVYCEFCNQRYEFDRIDIKQLFISNVLPSTIDRGKDTTH